MRSAIYYPHTNVKSMEFMKSSLLMWDRLHTIIPESWYRPEYEDSLMSNAWELIGKGVVPDIVEKELAHRSIAGVLETGIPPEWNWLDANGTSSTYEIWPQKFSDRTWQMLTDASMTTKLPLPNGDYPMTREAGVLLMAKLADTIAGDAFARVTDQASAFVLSPDPISTDKGISTGGADIEETHLMLLEVVDMTQISFERTIDFRERELKERRGYDYTAMRHRYADALNAHIAELKVLITPRQRKEARDEFRSKMEEDLRDLAQALMGNKTKLALKPIVVGTVVSGVAAAHSLDMSALWIAGAAALGTTAAEITDKMAKIIEACFGFSEKQRDIMIKHPMAYLYEFSRSA